MDELKEGFGNELVIESEKIVNSLEKISKLADYLYSDNDKELQKLACSVLEQSKEIANIYRNFDVNMPFQDKETEEKCIYEIQKACQNLIDKSRRTFNLANNYALPDNIMAIDDKKRTSKTLYKASFTLSEENYIKLTTDHVPPNTRTIASSAVQYKFQIREQFEQQVHFKGKRLKKVFIIVLNHYNSSSKTVRDNDNYYNKVLMDLTAREFVSGDDSPNNVQYLSFAIANNKAFTEIYVIPNSDFPRWIAENQAILEI